MSEFDLKTDDKQPEKKPARDFEIDTKDNGSGKGGNLGKLTVIAAAVAGVAVLGYVGMSMLGGGSGPSPDAVLDAEMGEKGRFDALIERAEAVQQLQAENGVFASEVNAEHTADQLRGIAEKNADAQELRAFLDTHQETPTQDMQAPVEAELMPLLRKYAEAPSGAGSTIDVIRQAYKNVVFVDMTALEKIRSEDSVDRRSVKLLLSDMAGKLEEVGTIEANIERVEFIVSKAERLHESYASERESHAEEVREALTGNGQPALEKRDAGEYRPVHLIANDAESLNATFYETDSETLVLTVESEGDLIGWLPPYESLFVTSPYRVEVDLTCSDGRDFQHEVEFDLHLGNSIQNFFVESCTNPDLT